MGRSVRGLRQIDGEQGTPHLQGFAITHNQTRLSSMRKLHGSAHWTICKGSWEQNYEYCTKDGDFTEHGVKPTTKRQRGDGEKQRWENAKMLRRRDAWTTYLLI
eukprot:gene12426-15625_t